MSFVPAEILQKKRAGLEHSRDELHFLIEGFVANKIPDYQVSAWLMAVFFNGMSHEEAAHLAEVMLRSGEVLDFSHLSEKKVDKHSTGGVGDKTSMILAPLVAAAGLRVPMIAGRGLGHTGGTLDKLESIPGFVTGLDLQAFQKQVETLGFAMVGQTAEICPADKKLYALRDVTATVESLPLICGSIMSKKIAEGIDALVLDVKYGSGAFMKTLEDARALAKGLSAIGELHGKKVAALLTNMNQPMGRFIGNSLEIEECMAILKNEEIYGLPLSAFEDTREVTLQLAAHMIWLGEKAASAEEGYKIAEELLNSGKAYENFEKMCEAQGGNLSQLPKPVEAYEVIATESGHLSSYETAKIGMASLVMGAGRIQKGDEIDPVAGLQVHKKIGDEVERGDVLFTLYASKDDVFAEAEKRLLDATVIGKKPEVEELITEKLLPKN